jgi:hypothetical protein
MKMDVHSDEIMVVADTQSTGMLKFRRDRIKFQAKNLGNVLMPSCERTEGTEWEFKKW